MTPDDWRTSDDPYAMLTWLHRQGTLSERRARLFSAAVCRRLWPRLADERVHRVVDVIETQADGRIGPDDLGEARMDARMARRAAAWRGDRVGEFAAEAAHQGTHPGVRLAAVRKVAGAAAVAGAWTMSDDQDGGAWRAAWSGERIAQAVLLRDLLSPFREVDFDSSLLTWNHGTLPKLAQAAYDDRILPEGTLDPTRLAVLADALEEAGVVDQELLGHLREQGGVHVRGCWVVDLLLGKG